MTFFIDNNLSQALAKGMHGFGEDVIHLVDKFPSTARDEEWLKYVGKNDMCLVTRDEKIRSRPNELAALKNHKVGAFFLGGKNLSRCTIIQQLVRNWPRMKEYSAKTPRPFAFRVPANGTTFQKLF